LETNPGSDALGHVVLAVLTLAAVIAIVLTGSHSLL
jgi:hypothetical protein